MNGAGEKTAQPYGFSQKKKNECVNFPPNRIIANSYVRARCIIKGKVNSGAELKTKSCWRWKCKSNGGGALVYTCLYIYTRRAGQLFFDYNFAFLFFFTVLLKPSTDTDGRSQNRQFTVQNLLTKNCNTRRELCNEYYYRCYGRLCKS